MQNYSIITTRIEDLTLSSKMLRLETSRGDVIIDIKQMMKEPVNSENAYFNATRIADLFPPHKKLSKFMNLTSTKEYLELLKKEFSLIDPKRGQSRIETHRVDRGKETEETRGKKGTYLHNEMFFEFLGWCDVGFRRELHKAFKQIVIHTNELKIERDNTKILFKDLTKSIKNHYIPAQTSDNAKKFAYSNLSGLINIKVLGSTASKYAKDNSIEVEQGKSVRDYLSKEQLEQTEEQERVMSGLIEFAGVTEYEELKELLNG